MRKGLSSSRGAIRGTIGGAPVGRVGTGGFATVAIRFGPFRYRGVSGYVQLAQPLPAAKTSDTNRWRQTCACPPNISPGNPGSKSAAVLHLREVESLRIRRGACRKRGRARAFAKPHQEQHQYRDGQSAKLQPCCARCGVASTRPKKRSGPRKRSEGCEQ